MLARDTGAIVKSSGLITSSVSDPRSTHGNSRVSNGDLSSLAAAGEAGTGNGEEKGLTRADEVAGMVWNFVGAAGGLIRGLNQEDDVKLLRLRTKKNELVIVPGESA